MTVSKTALFTSAFLLGLIALAPAAQADDRGNWHRDFGDHGTSHRDENDHHDNNDRSSSNNTNSNHGETDGSSRQAYQSGYQDGVTGHSHRGDHANGSEQAYREGFEAGLKRYNSRDGYAVSRGAGRSDRHDYGYGAAYPSQPNVVVVNPRAYQDQYDGGPGYYAQPYGNNGYGGSQPIPGSALHSRTYYYSNGYGSYGY